MVGSFPAAAGHSLGELLVCNGPMGRAATGRGGGRGGRSAGGAQWWRGGGDCTGRCTSLRSVLGAASHQQVSGEKGGEGLHHLRTATTTAWQHAASLVACDSPHPPVGQRPAPRLHSCLGGSKAITHAVHGGCMRTLAAEGLGTSSSQPGRFLSLFPLAPAAPKRLRCSQWGHGCMGRVRADGGVNRVRLHGWAALAAGG